MAFLVVDGLTVPVSAQSVPEETRVEVGEVVPAFDGTPRSSVRSRRSEWAVETIAMPAATANALRVALEASSPVLCSGDMLGASVYCVVTDIQVAHSTIGTSRRKALSFRLLGA